MLHVCTAIIKNVIVDSLRMPGYIQSGRIVDQDQRGELKLHQSHYWARVGVVWWNICRCKKYGLPWERKDMEVPSKKHKAGESRKLVIEKIEFSSFHSLIQCKTCSRTSKSDSIEFYKFNVAKMYLKFRFKFLINVFKHVFFIVLQLFKTIVECVFLWKKTFLENREYSCQHFIHCYEKIKVFLLKI